MKKNKEENKITFRDLWHNPFYNSLFKLLLWGLFILFIFILLAIGNKRTGNINPNENNNVVKINYSAMKKNILNNSVEVIYTIGDYYINGTVSGNILEATLETTTDEIYKIKYDGENLYQIKKGVETVDEELLKDINLKYLLPEKVFSIIDDPKIIAKKSADEKTYNYDIGDVIISVVTSDESIDEINIVENNLNYNLKYTIKK